MWEMTHNYYVDIARKLMEQGDKIKVIGAIKSPEYWPSSLDEFIKTSGARVISWEDFATPEQFNKALDPDFSFLTPNVLSELSHYEKMFLMSTDRLSFFPISQIDRCRLFYKMTGHFYKILEEEKIDVVVFFAIPHGLADIALFGLAKILRLKVVYVDEVTVSPELSIIETDIKTGRSYCKQELELGYNVNKSDFDAAKQLINNFRNASEFAWNAPKYKNRIKTFLEKIGSLLLRKPFGKYVNSSFFLNSGRRLRISYILPLIRYYIHTLRATNFYDKHAVNVCEESNFLALFLHMQPEASTMPQSGIYADQLLVLDLILEALPKGMSVYVKEHPLTFYDQFSQDRHERSVEFYKYMLRDPRVHFVKKTFSGQELMRKAKYVASSNGSISWETMRGGNPCIIFGWAWFAPCQSCYVVDSVESLKDAFDVSAKKSSSVVAEDVNEFLDDFVKRVIFATPNRTFLEFVGSNFAYDRSVANLSNAIAIATDLSSSERLAAPINGN
jgi:hypothetical protein